jgi:hypothetical protein
MIHLERNDSVFYEMENTQSAMLEYALTSGNFVCITTSGTVS